jgi:hypothetical protein
LHSRQLNKPKTIGKFWLFAFRFWDAGQTKIGKLSSDFEGKTRFAHTTGAGKGDQATAWVGEQVVQGALFFVPTNEMIDGGG